MHKLPPPNTIVANPPNNSNFLYICYIVGFAFGQLADLNILCILFVCDERIQGFELTFNVYASSQLVVAACVDLEITEISHLCLSGDVG